MADADTANGPAAAWAGPWFLSWIKHLRRIVDLERVLYKNMVIRSFTPKETAMPAKNEGTLDRVLRIVTGLVLLALAATGSVGAWGWIGLVPLATGLMGWCPLYTVLGIRTCPNR
ncbi:hypothetical protein ISF6_5430 [Piscinibacter sakaiensis]|uniref:Inner membrane protein YgaP-like transmembrane domain-containing protein n=2 Tax=Piscinibacter sakaiensis TaxID=1547922 RepID=A0A0K8NWE9_PISS1|nr:hypothetical protein ISF6_5430 [Piscinibacter sakaiensis]